MAIFKGAGVAIVTPMKENKEVNYEKLEELLEFQIAGGTDAIVICGTTGEASTLSHEEHLECVRFAIDKVAKRIPVIAGTGSNSTETAIYLSKEAELAGADGVLLVTPYYNKATQNGLTLHFTEIAKNIDIPIILYNVPSRTGCTLQPATIAGLVRNVDNIVGVKDATGDLAETLHLMQLCNGEIDLYSGNDDIIVPVLSAGGKGVISVLSNVAPRETHDICAKFFEGKTAESLALQLKYFPLVKALFSEVNPIPVKCALNLMGKAVGSLRLPLTELEAAHKEVLAREMKAVGLI